MLKRYVLLVVLLCLLALPPLGARAQNSDMAFVVPGLDGEVTIRYDAMGIPHIYATTTHDLLMAQGFVHAADRWWQMEWFRHIGAGRLSELAGGALAGTDTFLRTLGTVRNAENDLAHMSQDTVAALQAYADGVNAWTGGKPAQDLALEYLYLNLLRSAFGAPAISQVEPWTPLNTMTWLQVMSLDLNGNYGDELARYSISSTMGADALAVYAPGYDYATMPLILEPGWQPLTQAESALQSNALTAAIGQPALAALSWLRDREIGSNNWVVSGRMTESGLPLLANDPHLGIQMPSIWYENGLHCVEITADCPYDVVGYSFAGTPLVIIGHNAHIGWGFTNVGTDVQDLYLLEINPDNPNQYRVDGEWLDMDVLTETINPFDDDPVEIEVRVTRFGPVVNGLFEVEQPMALRWGASDVSRTFEAIALYNRAANWDEFQEAATYFDGPGQNMVYADVDGNIGYIMSGRIPIRAQGHDGTQPVDGTTTAFDWQGYVDAAQNPRLFNPEAGYVVTANNAVLRPEDFPQIVTLDWDYGYRAARIETLIQSYAVHNLDTMAAIQFDNHDSGAAMLVPLLAATDLGDEDLNEYAAWLAEWDFQNDADSPHAALYNAFWDALSPALFEETGIFGGSFALYNLSLMLADANHPLWNNEALGTADPAAFLSTALQEAVAFMTATYGDDRAAWRWGDMHMARFRGAPLGQLPQGLNPTLDAVLPRLYGLFNRETPASGGSSVVNNTGWAVGSGDFAVAALPSMRMILDFSDFDSSRFIHTTGQSGDPQSVHFDDMVALWAAGGYHPHYFSADAVEGATVATWTLTPSG